MAGTAGAVRRDGPRVQGVIAGNAFVGGGAGVATQVVTAFFGGTLFYIARRATGTLLVPILLHGLFGFSVFSHTGDTRSSSGVESQILVAVALVLSAAVMIKHHAWSDTTTTQDA